QIIRPAQLHERSANADPEDPLMHAHRCRLVGRARHEYTRMRNAAEVPSRVPRKPHHGLALLDALQQGEHSSVQRGGLIAMSSHLASSRGVFFSALLLYSIPEIECQTGVKPT